MEPMSNDEKVKFFKDILKGVRSGKYIFEEDVPVYMKDFYIRYFRCYIGDKVIKLYIESNVGKKNLEYTGKVRLKENEYSGIDEFVLDGGLVLFQLAKELTQEKTESKKEQMIDYNEVSKLLKL